MSSDAGNHGFGAGPPPEGAGPAAPPAVPAPALRPLSVGDVLDGMFRLVVSHWRVYLVALGVVLVPLSLLTSALQSVTTGGRGMLEMFNDPAAAEALTANQFNPVAFGSLYAATLLTAIFITPFVTAMACGIASEAFWQRDPQPWPSLRWGLRRYWAAWSTAVLSWIASLLLLVPGAVLIGVGAAAESAAPVIVGVVVVLAGFVAMAGLRVLFALAYPIVMVERRGPVAALRRSWGLVRPSFWRVFGIVWLTAIIASVVGSVLSSPFSVVGALFGSYLQFVATAVGAILAGIVTTPLSANARTLLYYDGRIRREGLDLSVRIDQMTGQPQTGSTGLDAVGG